MTLQLRHRINGLIEFTVFRESPVSPHCSEWVKGILVTAFAVVLDGMHKRAAFSRTIRTNCATDEN
jgi:hypothetical protein